MDGFAPKLHEAGGRVLRQQGPPLQPEAGEERDIQRSEGAHC